MKNLPSYRFIGSILLAGLIVPILLGSVMYLTLPSISPGDAARRVEDPKEKAVLIDVRSRKEYDAFSLLKARSLPATSMTDRAMTERVLKGADSVFVICDTGFEGYGAVRSLQSLGYRNVRNVSGGMDAWLAIDAAIDKTTRTEQGKRAGVTAVSWPLLDQTSIVLAAFFLKPSYQIISIVIIILLWKRMDQDLAAIKWAMLAFLIGESACAANYLFFHDHSLLMEFFHMYGMILCFGLVTYAFMETVDNRVLHYSERQRPCTLVRQCGRCYKYHDVSCTLRSLFLILIPAVAVVAAIPLSGSLAHRLYEGMVFGTVSVFGQPVAYQYLEARIFPMLSLFFLGIALIELLSRKEDGFGASKVWFAMGMGPLGFSLMRFFLYWGYQDRPLWADVWEEITEFLLIILLFWIAVRVRKASRTFPQGSVENLSQSELRSE